MQGIPEGNLEAKKDHWEALLEMAHKARVHGDEVRNVTASIVSNLWGDAVTAKPPEDPAPPAPNGIYHLLVAELASLQQKLEETRSFLRRLQ
jgi:hypothetical protein